MLVMIGSSSRNRADSANGSQPAAGTKRAARTASPGLRAFEPLAGTTPLGATDFLVADANGAHLAVYDQNLVFLGYFAQDITNPFGLDFLSNLNVIALNHNPVEVREYDILGNLISHFGTPAVLGNAPIDLKANRTPLASSFRVYDGRRSATTVPEVNFSGTKTRSFGSNTYDGIAVLPGSVMWAGGVNYPQKIDVFDLATGSGDNIAPTSTIDLNDGHGQSVAESMFYSAVTNTVLTVDFNNNTVVERNTNGTFVRTFIPPMGSALQFGVTRGPGDDVFATDFNGNIVRWKPDGTLIGATASTGVSQPTGILWMGNLPCTITCPGNKAQSNDPNQCGAVVTYSDPTTTGSCNTVICSPASGTLFPVGTTTVTCKSNNGAGPDECTFTVMVSDTQQPMITCPNKTQSTDPGQCQAKVTFSPAVSDNCPNPGAPVCAPASGSVFPKGTTTVNCSVKDAAGNMASCTFTVTVNDTEAPTITCQADATTVPPASCPIAVTSPPVTFTVNASDNCPGVTFVCKDQNNQVVTSGMPFPMGTTSVTCTATDTSGNTATCSFIVSAFSFCLQDESNPGNSVLVNAQTGVYVFCCGGTTVASGTGTLTTRGCIGSIDNTKGDRQVHIQWDTSANSGNGAGTAFIQKLSSKVVCQITDKNMSNNTCQCSTSPPPVNPKKPPLERTY